ncbi:Mediator of RNA polymerase II transcription subunit 12 [Strongyloides ratti]|uniref:Mediator of RNA polymerase II transcription subunit 12 n=1 Tax=Strongyloides ratti TaxID=34506 RepID=A0A090MMN7_STRRB|nr:Mediator of RNA polymerase II transcription subunit 12 [Strongyloides ratti]CEF59276.1 Mediator of RNA polymerase II transcription subunit 12 [Strongyloides ratti]
MFNSNRSYKVANWNTESSEKRPIRKASRGRHFDIFPQDSKQDEDNLSSYDRIRKGYIYPQHSYEHESLIYNQKTSKIDSKLEDTIKKANNFFITIMKKRSYDNPKSGKRSLVTKAFTVNEWNFLSKIPKCPSIPQFFEDLSKGKALYGLIKRFPQFEKNEDFLKYLFDHRVPIVKAIWFIKMVAIFKATHIPIISKPPKKSQALQSALEYVQSLISGLIIYTFNNFYNDDKSEDEKSDRWNYFSLLIKHMCEEGVLDRQDFLTDMIDLLNKYQNFPLDKPQRFKILFLFVSQFIHYVTQNIIISRRMAFIICRRFKQYHYDYMNITGKPITAGEAFTEIIKCENHRGIVNSMTGMLYSIITECPQALPRKYMIYVKKFTGVKIYDELGGSPLDELSCPFDIMCKEANLLPSRMIELMKPKINEIIERSIDMKYQWHEVISGKTYCSELVNVILKLLETLDNVFLINDDEIVKLHDDIFKCTMKMDDNIEIILRKRMLIHWSITSQRDGTHRVALVVRILSVHLKDVKDKSSVMINILNDYIYSEAPKLGYCNYGYEFRNFILLLNDLQSFGLINYRKLLDYWIKKGRIEKDNCLWGKTVKYVYGENYERDFHPIWNKNILMSSRYALQFYRRDSEKHTLLNLEGVTPEERIILQLPILPSIYNREDIYYRDRLMFGISIQKNEHISYIKEIARGIIKVWRKLYYFKIETNKTNIHFHEYHDVKRYNNCGDILCRFRRQTYYDQTLITYWVADNFKEYISAFIENTNDILPGLDGLDYILRMFCISMNIGGMINYILEILPKISKLEDIMLNRYYNFIPGIITKGYAFTIVAYLSEHLMYFLNHPNVINVINELYHTIENTILLKGYPRTGYEANISVFISQCKYYLLVHGIAKPNQILGCVEDFEKLYPKKFIDIKIEQSRVQVKKYFFSKYLNSAPTLLPFNEIRSLIKGVNNNGINCRISFVLSAINLIKTLGRKINKISSVANYCANVSALLNLENEWISAIVELCSISNNPQSMYRGVHKIFNVSRTTTHYALSTFVAILAARFTFRPHELIGRLMKSSLVYAFRGTYNRSRYGYQKIILSALICTKIVTGYHDPFKLPRGYSGLAEVKRPVVKKLSDFKACNVLFPRELDSVIFPLIRLFVMVNRPIKKLRKNRAPKKIRVNHFLRACLLFISEQPWFYQKMHFGILNRDGNWQQFKKILLKNFGIPGILLNYISRRKGDRRAKLMNISCAENSSKKAYIERSLSSLNIWNFKTVFWDLWGIMTDSTRKPQMKNYPQRIYYCDQLITEIAKGISDLFVKKSNSFKKHIDFKTDTRFRLETVKNLYLIENIVMMFPNVWIPRTRSAYYKMQVTTLPTAVLKEFSFIITSKYTKNNYALRMEQMSHLLHISPFLKFLQTILNKEPQTTYALLQGLYGYLSSLMKDFDSRRLLRSHLISDKEGLILRVIIVSGMMDQLSTMQTMEPWAILFWQLLYFEVFHPEREGKFYNICYDALTNVLFNSAFKFQSRHIEHAYYRARYWTYMQFCKKLKKEGQDRPFTVDKQHLSQLLPLPKRTFDYIIFDHYYKMIGKAKNTYNVSCSSSNAMKLINRTGYYPAEKIKLTTFETVQSFFHELLGRRTVNYSFYQAVLADYVPKVSIDLLIRLSFHDHYRLFPRAPIIGEGKELTKNFMYRHPEVELTIIPKEEKEKGKIKLMPPRSLMNSSMTTNPTITSNPQIAAILSHTPDKPSSSPGNIIKDSHNIPIDIKQQPLSDMPKISKEVINDINPRNLPQNGPGHVGSVQSKPPNLIDQGSHSIDQSNQAPQLSKHKNETLNKNEIMPQQISQSSIQQSSMHNRHILTNNQQPMMPPNLSNVKKSQQSYNTSQHSMQKSFPSQDVGMGIQSSDISNVNNNMIQKKMHFNDERTFSRDMSQQEPMQTDSQPPVLIASGNLGKGNRRRPHPNPTSGIKTPTKKRKDMKGNDLLSPPILHENQPIMVQSGQQQSMGIRSFDKNQQPQQVPNFGNQGNFGSQGNMGLQQNISHKSNISNQSGITGQSNIHNQGNLPNLGNVSNQGNMYSQGNIQSQNNLHEQSNHPNQTSHHQSQGIHHNQSSHLNQNASHQHQTNQLNQNNNIGINQQQPSNMFISNSGPPKITPQNQPQSRLAQQNVNSMNMSRNPQSSSMNTSNNQSNNPMNILNHQQPNNMNHPVHQQQPQNSINIVGSQKSTSINMGNHQQGNMMGMSTSQHGNISNNQINNMNMSGQTQNSSINRGNHPSQQPPPYNVSLNQQSTSMNMPSNQQQSNSLTMQNNMNNNSINISSNQQRNMINMPDNRHSSTINMPVNPQNPNINLSSNQQNIGMNIPPGQQQSSGISKSNILQQVLNNPNTTQNIPPNQQYNKNMGMVNNPQQGNIQQQPQQKPMMTSSNQQSNIPQHVQQNMGSGIRQNPMGQQQAPIQQNMNQKMYGQSNNSGITKSVGQNMMTLGMKPQNLPGPQPHQQQAQQQSSSSSNVPSGMLNNMNTNIQNNMGTSMGGGIPTNMSGNMSSGMGNNNNIPNNLSGPMHNNMSNQQRMIHQNMMNQQTQQQQIPQQRQIQEGGIPMQQQQQRSQQLGNPQQQISGSQSQINNQRGHMHNPQQPSMSGMQQQMSGHHQQIPSHQQQIPPMQQQMHNQQQQSHSTQQPIGNPQQIMGNPNQPMMSSSQQQQQQHWNIQQGSMNKEMQGMNPNRIPPINPNIVMDRGNMRAGSEAPLETKKLLKDMLKQKTNPGPGMHLSNQQHPQSMMAPQQQQQQQMNMTMSGQVQHNQGPMMNTFETNQRQEMLYRNSQQHQNVNMGMINQQQPQQGSQTQQQYNSQQMYP